MSDPPNPANKSASGPAPAVGLLGQVKVVLRDGRTIEGAIDNFNPRSTGFFLSEAGGDKARNVLFEDLRWVAFKGRPGESPVIALRPDDRLIQVRFDDGSSVRGVTTTTPGGKAGFFLVPSDGDEADRTFVAVGAVREVISLERLGDILEREGLVSAAAVRKALKRQEEIRQERVGNILVREGRIRKEQLDEGLKAQQGSGERRLGEILKERGFINDDDLAEALTAQEAQRGRRLGEVMVEMGLATRKMIAIALAIQYNVPFVDLSAQSFDPRLKILVSRDTAATHLCLPLSVQQGVLTLAICDPTDLAGRDAVGQATGLTTVIVVAAQTEILRAIDRYYGSTGG
jgi:MshEN domain/Family of unknown function (DUF6982)